MSLTWLCAGVLVGLLNALTMSATVHRLTPARGLYGIIGGMALRWVLAAALLVVALRHGAEAGLLAFGGLWLARWAAIALFAGGDRSGKGPESGLYHQANDCGTD